MSDWARPVTMNPIEMSAMAEIMLALKAFLMRILQRSAVTGIEKEREMVTRLGNT